MTIVAKEGKLCDALSTSLFIMGREKAEGYWREHGDFEMILITDEGELYITEGISDAFSLSGGFGNMEVHVVGKEKGE